MTIGASLFLIAVGAILNFAVTATVAGIDLQTVGVILMIVGGVGLRVRDRHDGHGEPQGRPAVRAGSTTATAGYRRVLRR